MTSQDIQKSLDNLFSDAKYLVNNCYFFAGKYKETDKLIINQNGILVDVEIKVSRQDYKCEFKKVHKHQILSDKEGIFKDKPNRFYFAVPENLIKVEEVPEYAGLIYVKESGYCATVKKAPLLHKDRIQYAERLLGKLYFGYREALSYRDSDTYRELKAKISTLTKNLVEKDELNLKLKRENTDFYFELKRIEHKKLAPNP